MRAKYWIISMFTMAFIVLLTYIAANPLPYAIIDESMTPVPDTDTPLFLKSEEVIFNITGEEIWGETIVNATGRFIVANPTNDTINQSIIFPFYENMVFPYENMGKYSFEILSLSVNGTQIPYEHIKYKYYPSISFNISAGPYEELSFNIAFITFCQTSINHYRISYKYITTSGKEWNHPIEHAYFKFIIINSVIWGNLSGVDEFTRNETHTVGTIEHFNWTPETDLDVGWYTPHYYEYYSRPRVTLMFPSDGVICANPPILQWTTTYIYTYNQTLYYDIYWSEVEKKVRMLDPGVRIASGITDTTFKPDTFRGEYHWTVIPWTNTTVGTCSNILKCIGDCDCVLDIKLYAPEDKAVINTTELTLCWNLTWSWKTVYTVYFGEVRSLVVNRNEDTNLSYRQDEKYVNVTGLKDGHTYYWVVDGYDGVPGISDSVRSFTVRIDSDGDGVRDSEDAFPDDPARSTAPVDEGIIDGLFSHTVMGVVIWTLSVIAFFAFLVLVTYLLLKKRRRES